ncbi:host attachment protein [Ensifer soli]|uniref:host attachment protein n=1 Tax=Ciceribacter sp. sgz301302 TaxID=3342379 RepID=UPI0035B99704
MTNTWILAADGSTCRLLKGVNFLKDEPQTPEQEIFQTEARKAQDIKSDRPGRSHSSVGPGRSAMEYSSDPVRVDQQGFAADVADTIDRYAKEGAFDRLVLCAAPQTLGDLRGMLSQDVLDRTSHEISKNYSNLPTDKLIANVRSAIFDA